MVKYLLIGLGLVVVSLVYLVAANTIAVAVVVLTSLPLDFYTVICVGILGVSAYVLGKAVTKIKDVEDKRYSNYWRSVNTSREKGGKKWWLQS